MKQQSLLIVLGIVSVWYVFAHGRTETHAPYLGSCGGVFIAPRIFLTAAHCVRPTHVGMRFFSGGSNGRISKIIVHPSYDVNSKDDVEVYNDIALVVIDRPVSKQFVHPLATRPPGEDEPLLYGEKRLRRSFGINAIVENAAGKRMTDHPGYFIATSQEKIACRGNSGDPIFVHRDGRDYVVGIASWGPENCAPVHGVYITAWVNVSHYIPWIQKNLESLSSFI